MGYPVLHKRLKPKRGAPPKGAEAFHMDRVGEMPCIVTGSPESVVHHIMHMKGKRAGRDHRYIVPLTPELHNMGNTSVHLLGSEAKFQQIHDVDLIAEAIRLWAETLILEKTDG